MKIVWLVCYDHLIKLFIQAKPITMKHRHGHQQVDTDTILKKWQFNVITCVNVVSESHSSTCQTLGHAFDQKCQGYKTYTS